MIDLSKPTAPEIHAAAQRLAFGFVALIEALLPSPEARGLALREAYRLAREELERVRGP